MTPDTPIPLRADVCFLADAEIARRLKINERKWPFVKQCFEADGMPAKDPVVGMRYWPAVVAWLDRRAGIGAASDPFRERGKEHWDEKDRDAGTEDKKARRRNDRGVVGSLKLFPPNRGVRAADGPVE